MCRTIAYLNLLLIFLAKGLSAQNSAQTSNLSIPSEIGSPFVSQTDIFGTRGFIENKGQFDKSLPDDKKIHFVYENGGEKIYFTDKGLVYEFIKLLPHDENEEEEERKEKGKITKEVSAPTYYVEMNWLNALPNIKIEAEEKQGHYITYGGSEFDSHVFKKIRYSNVYEKIDIEFNIPSNKTYGVKYNVIVHPGANPSEIKILYSGDVSKIRKEKNGDILIRSTIDNITEHAPESFYENGEPVSSEFLLEGNILSFNFSAGYDSKRKLIIDPWVTAVASLLANNQAYDVDFDNSGNAFIYGGNPAVSTGRCKVAKYNTLGALVWTFSGIIVTPAWNSGSSWSSNFKVHKPSGKVYVGRHIVGPAGAIRLDALGNYDNFMTNGGVPAMQELWHLDFACNGDLMAFLGNQYSGAQIDNVTGTVSQVSTFNPFITGCCQDVLAEVQDGVGELYVYHSGSAPLNNSISKVAPSYSTTVWNQSVGFSTFTYLQSKTQYVGGTTSNGNAVAFNALDVNMSYLYFYDGFNLAAYNKTTGTLVANTTLAGHAAKAQGGIAVDDCNNVYLGGNGQIRCYNFNGTTFSTLTPIPLNASVTSQYVYDIQLNKASNLLFVSGSEFVGTYSATNSGGCLSIINSCSCIQPFLAVSTVSTGCSNIGSSTVNVGGMPGPYTYSWSPGAQTTSIITGMNPGTYTVSVTSTSCNITTSAITVFTSSLPPYSLNVNSNSITCASLGSATVSTSGMPGPFSYTWMPSAQTTSVASGLSPGNYTLSIYSAGCNLTFTATTLFTSLIPLTGSVAYVNSVSCNGASTGTGAVTNLAGGSGNQSFSWFNGTTNYSTAATNSLSSGIWTLNVTDALTGCQIYQSFYISQPPPLNITMSSNTSTACVGTNIVITGTNSGGSPGYTYSWSAGPGTDTQTVTSSIAGNYVYTLNSTDANSCFSSNTISIGFIALPIISVPVVSICPLETGTLVASGATSYTWNGSSFGASLSGSPLASQQYSVLGAALGCTSSATSSIIVKALPSPYILSNSPICNGQFLSLAAFGGTAYVWNGPQSFLSSNQSTNIAIANISNAGVYQITVTAANSCTADASATVVVNPTPTLSAIGATVCSSQTLNLGSVSLPGATFLWNGPLSFSSTLQNPVYINPAPNRSGNYTVVATSAVGCTNSAVANVTVTLLPTPIAGSDGPKCVGSTINFSSGGGTSYSWIGPAGFASAQQFPQINLVSMSAMGNYSITVNIGPCVNSTTYSLTVFPLPVVSATNSGPTCETKTLQLIANTQSPVNSYFWLGPLYSSSSPNPIRDSSTIAFTGVYTLTVMDQNQCISSAQTTISILTNPIISASGATVCLDQPAMLSASGAVSYLWFGPGNFQSNIANAYIPSVTYARVGTYTVIGSAANSCTGVATSLVKSRSLPVPTMTVLPKSEICLNENLTFSGGGGKLYQWYGPHATFYEGQNITFNASNLSTMGTYSLKVTDEKGCSASISTLITVYNLPSGSLVGTKMEGCVPLCSDFVFYPNTFPASKLQSTWNVNGRIVEGQKFSGCFLTPGTHTLVGSLYDSTTLCKNSISFYVKTFEKPKADFEFAPLNPIENTDEVIFTNTSTGAEQTMWHWYVASNKSYSSRNENTSYLFSDQGNYPVVLVVRNAWGCADTVIKTIIVAEDFHIYVPNVFTPNSDNLNEVFLPIGRGVKSFQLKIYNRWGEMIFESASITNGWDGTYSGSACKSDVYTWKIYVQSIHGEYKSITGHVQLIR